jgi:hypothetical protein
MSTLARPGVCDDLRELVAALDRRVPRLEREGEYAIAREASILRAEALRRLRELEQQPMPIDVVASVADEHPRD